MTEEDFDRVLDALSQTHKGYHAICAELNLSVHEFKNTLDRDKERYAKYVRARDAQLNYLEELLLRESFNDESDEKPFVGANHVNRDRLKVDTLKFVLSKLRTQVWGDRIEVTHKEEPRIFNVNYGVPNDNGSTEDAANEGQ
jgi:hypothetical protein